MLPLGAVKPRSLQAASPATRVPLFDIYEDNASDRENASPSNALTSEREVVEKNGSVADATGSLDGNEEELPSMGSAGHALGTCKRCNFFAKGRCHDGRACAFCHLPHAKHKATRQEKRDRRAAWLNEQSATTSFLAGRAPALAGGYDADSQDLSFFAFGEMTLDAGLPLSAPPGLSPPRLHHGSSPAVVSAAR